MVVANIFMNTCFMNTCEPCGRKKGIRYLCGHLLKSLCEAFLAKTALLSDSI